MNMRGHKIPRSLAPTGASRVGFCSALRLSAASGPLVGAPMSRARVAARVSEAHQKGRRSAVQQLLKQPSGWLCCVRSVTGHSGREASRPLMRIGSPMPGGHATKSFAVVRVGNQPSAPHCPKRQSHMPFYRCNHRPGRPSGFPVYNIHPHVNEY